MVELLMVATVTGGACWGFNKWLASQERQRFMQPLETRPRGAAKVIDMTEPRQIIHVTQAAKPAANGNASKYVVMALCAIYIICPLDFIPDFIPVLGWGDDLVAMLIGFQQLLSTLFARKA